MGDIEAAQPNLTPTATRVRAEEQITATYPSGLQQYGYSMGHKALAWLTVGDMYVDAMQNAATPVPDKELREYSEIRRHNHSAINIGSAWFAYTYATLWNEQAACSMDEREPASLVIGKFDPYAVEEQAWMTGLLTAMSLRLQQATGHSYDNASVSFEVPDNNWEVDLSRTTTDFADQHKMVIAEAHVPGTKPKQVTEFAVNEAEDRVWGSVLLPNESTIRLVGLRALGLANAISAHPFETIQIAQRPIAMRARLFAAAEQAA